MTKYKIEDDLLRQLLTYEGTSSALGQIRGYPYSKANPQYGFLITLARLAFGLYRLPGFEDRMLCHVDLESREVFASVDPAQIEKSVDALKRMYQHGQAALRAQFPTGRAKLVRGIRVLNHWTAENTEEYAAGIYDAVKLATARGDPTVRLEMDTINSFSATAESYPGYAGIDLHLEVPIEDILTNSNIIDETEGGDWLVLNRSPTGLVEIPVENIRPAPWVASVMMDRAPPRDDKPRTIYVQTHTPRSLAAPRVIRLALAYEKWKFARKCARSREKR